MWWKVILCMLYISDNALLCLDIQSLQSLVSQVRCGMCQFIPRSENKLAHNLASKLAHNLASYWTYVLDKLVSTLYFLVCFG